MNLKLIKSLVVAGSVVVLFTINACNPDPKDGDQNDGDTTKQTVKVNNNFDMDSAYAYVQKQVDFGPRVPNTASHRACGDWLEKQLKTYCDTVYTQAFIAKSFKGDNWNARNFIGVFNPKSTNRLLLCAHWDTRPWADQDSINPTTPSDGASDGASGVGILLEVARQLHTEKPEMGIDIIFFDVEDGGSNDNSVEKSWCLGSQYWANHQHVKDYRARNGILLDMVGGYNAVFAREQMSIIFDNYFLTRVWETASSMGYGNFFINYSKDGITDDHVYVTYEGKVPTIDIIAFEVRSKSGFPFYWHTHDDNMKAIDKNTLCAVGKTVLQVVRLANVNHFY